MYHIVVNPIAGHGRAKDFVQEHVTPLLDNLAQPYRIWTTTAPKHAGEIAQEILRTRPSDSLETPVRVIIAGGDGTAHELIEGVLEKASAGSPAVGWELIILPLGTANALHASLVSQEPRAVPTPLEGHISPDPDVRKSLSSLLSAMEPGVTPRPLPITITTFVDSRGEITPEGPISSHIVTSTSLHAALLQTSEELRAEYPGLERFKVAAERNLGVFFQADLKLLPAQGSTIKQYDPKTQSFVEPFTPDSDGVLKGPFTYLLSTTVCERLEPTFVINPTIRTIPTEQEGTTMDVIVLRPLRDPDVQRAPADEQHEKWKKRAMEVIGHAYKGGTHVDLTYQDQAGGGETVLRGDGPVAVETFRVGGFEWHPTDPIHMPSHLICADGAIHAVPTGGHARVEIASRHQETPTFSVFA